VAAAIAVALDPDAQLRDILQAGKDGAHKGRRYGHRWMGPSVPRRIGMAVEIARESLPERERLQEMYDVVGTTLAIAESVPAAFGVLVMSEGDPQQAAIYAAALSGDADTIGAMACAIAGAWRGAGAFDPEIVQALRSANPEFDFDGLAQGLLDLASG
jgi:ADP-ribosylglycohydrolase